jgi:WD40 repeat protein
MKIAREYLYLSNQCLPGRVEPIYQMPSTAMISRRAVLGQLIGLALAGGSLARLATSCGSASPRPAPTAPSQGTVLYIYRGHSSNVLAVAWSPDGKRIASASLDETVQVWDAVNGGRVYTYHGHHRPVNAVAWSPDGTRIASASDDMTMQVWDAVNGGHTYTYRGHTDAVKALAWSPNGRRIASGAMISQYRSGMRQREHTCSGILDIRKV